ncbi:MAG: hypothetical protein CR971_01210, partial [candidate division SR1 bacterium]
FHPGIELKKLLQEKSLTQKDMASLCGKNTSELNELIKGKRNFTIQRDIILHEVLGTPEQFWIRKQMDYEYAVAKQTFDTSNLTPYRSIYQEPEANLKTEEERKEEMQGDIQADPQEQNIPEHKEKMLDDDILANEEIVITDEEHPHHKVFDKF